MDVADLRDEVKRLNYDYNYSDTSAENDFNMIYHELENDIVTLVDEDFFTQISFTDLVADEIEYPLPVSANDTSGFKKLVQLSIKYDNDSIRIDSYASGDKEVTLATDYELAVGQTVKFYNQFGKLLLTDTIATIETPNTVYSLTNGLSTLSDKHILLIDDSLKEYYPARQISTRLIEIDENRLRNEQPKEQPCFKIYNNSLYIYPKSTIDVSNGLKLKWVRDLINLDISSTEDDIGISWQYHYVILDGMRRLNYQARGMLQEAQIQNERYQLNRRNMIKRLSNRNASPVEGHLPSLRHLE